MRADRLLSALLLLQANGKLTSRQLAERLEVSERTAHRDMEALSAAGVPVLSLRGSRGGWQLDSQWRTQIPGLDEAELRGLLMAQPRVVGDGPLAAAARRALDKLVASLPVTMRARAAFLRERLYVDTGGWYGRSEDLSSLPIVQDAVSRERKLTFRYKDKDRRVDPLGLVAKGSTWYLVAKTEEGFRTFRVSRIASVTVLDIPSERPADFDLAAHWNAATKEFRESRPRFEVVVRAEVKAAEELRRWHDAVPVDAHQDGSQTLRVHFADEHHARFVVMGMGAAVAVMEPVALRERVLAEAEKMVAKGASH